MAARDRQAEKRLQLTGTDLDTDDVVAVARDGMQIEISPDRRIAERVAASRQFIAQAVAEGEPIYGVTTGFGGMADIAIPGDQVRALQRNMLWYHKTGAGARLSNADVRAAMLLRANALLRGVSGVRMAVIQRLVDLVNAGVTPHVYDLGSIGASGDLVPLAYIAGAMIGLDDCFRVDLDGREMGACQALERLGLVRLELEAKEALALMNGTSVMNAVAAGCVYDARRLLAMTMAAHALFIQALRGSNQSFHPFIHMHKAHPGQVWAAAHSLDLLAGSQMVQDQMHGRHQHRPDDLIQDRYSLRCLPQYMGPIIDGLVAIGHQVGVEMNSVTDNPLIDAAEHAVYNGGNFLGQYIGVAMDQLRYYLGLMAKHLDVQIAMLVSPEFSRGLPGSLVGNTERRVNMGLKGLQLSGNSIMPLILFHGNSLADRFPTHAEQFNQNINSQGFGSANAARRSIELMQQYMAICLLFGVQAVDLRAFERAGHYDARELLSPATARLYEAVHQVTGQAPGRERAYVWDDDERPLDADIAALVQDIAGTRDSRIAAALDDTLTSFINHAQGGTRSVFGPASVQGSQTGSATEEHQAETGVNIARHVEHGAQNMADHVALVFEGRTFTYAALNQQVNRAARALASLGIERGDRVALFLFNTPDFIIAYLGIQKLGAIAVSVNTALLENEVQFILDDCGARALLTTTELAAQVPEDRLPALAHLLLVDAPAGDPRSFGALLEVASPQASAVSMRWNDPAAIVYSSGTTGFPKGATLSHGNVLSNIRAKKRYLDIRQDDRMLLFMPLFHCFGQNAIMNSALYAGATIVLMRRFQPQQVMDAIARDGVTMFFAIPTVFCLLLDRWQPGDLGKVRYFFSAAGPLPLEVEHKWQQKFGIAIHQGYGLTETSPFASYNHRVRYKLGSIGTPIDGVEMKIVDVEDGKTLMPGEQGEILVRGPNVMLGYWNRPRETAEIMSGDWLRTGDIGKMDYEGYFYIVDRLKDMINVGGLKVYPAEVENVLFKHSAVADVAVYGIADPVMGERIRADVVAKADCEIGADELRLFCRRQIANFKVPNVITFVNELPKSRTGKVLKRVLRQRAEQGAGQDAANE